jgi:hypothetical protein
VADRILVLSDAGLHASSVDPARSRLHASSTAARSTDNAR